MNCSHMSQYNVGQNDKNIDAQRRPNCQDPSTTKTNKKIGKKHVTRIGSHNINEQTEIQPENRKKSK